MIEEYDKNDSITCSCGYVHEGVAGDYIINKVGVIEEHECENCYVLFQAELTASGNVSFREGE